MEKDSPQEDAEYLSEVGFLRLKKELEELKSAKRKEIAMKLEYAKSLGDLSENAEYQEAKEEQLTIEARISELEDVLARAVLISHQAGGTIDLGSTVKVRRQDRPEMETYVIVGPQEADPTEQRISNESPLGGALLGKKRGEIITVYTPKGEIRYHIFEIS